MAEVDVNLTAQGTQVSEPWIWRLCREVDCKVTVTKASIDTDFGWMQVRLEGEPETINRAIAWLMTTGLHVEALTRSLGAV